MSFETSANIFSPDGRLLQLERALLSPNLSSNITFSIFENKLQLVFEQKNTPNIIPFKQIHKIHDNVYITFCGLRPDFFALKDHILYSISMVKQKELKVDILMIADLISDIFQTVSLSSNRPYGLQMLLFGFNKNNEMKSFIIETDGNYCEYFAGSLGRKKTEVIKLLEESELDHNTALKAVLEEVQSDKQKLDCFVIDQTGVNKTEFLIDE